MQRHGGADPPGTQLPAGEWVRRGQLGMAASQEQQFAYHSMGAGRSARVMFQGEPTQTDIDDLIEVLQIAKRRLPKATPDGAE